MRNDTFSAHAIAARTGLIASYLARIVNWIKQEYHLTYYAHIRWKAEKGDPMAQYILATMCEAGNGVFQTSAEAIKWYQKAAFKGIAQAQLAIAVKYLTGEGVTQNDSEAFLWFRKAADQSLPQAQYELAKLYSEGRGTPRDLVQARRWYAKAAEHGYADAKELAACSDKILAIPSPSEANEERLAA